MASHCALELDELSSRLVLVGSGVQTATVLTGALIVKEASKTPVEAYLGGEFRHGPIELAGRGLTAIIVDDPRSDSNDLERLAEELQSTGSTVKNLIPPVQSFELGDQSNLESLFFNTIAFQKLSVELAHRAGVVPGEFLYGRKITDAL